jgi:hypothetical protein
MYRVPKEERVKFDFDINEETILLEVRKAAMRVIEEKIRTSFDYEFNRWLEGEYIKVAKQEVTAILKEYVANVPALREQVRGFLERRLSAQLTALMKGASDV